MAGVVTTGDIMMVPTLNQYNLFINTAQAAQDLLEKKGHIYAARPVCLIPLHVATS